MSTKEEADTWTDTADMLLRSLSAAGRRGAESAELAAGLGAAPKPVAGAGPPAAALRELLEELEREGLVVEWGRRWYLIESTDWRVGRLAERRDGLTEVRSSAGRRYRVRDKNLGGARRGDRVLLKELRGPALGGVPEATVVRILERARRTTVGTLHRERPRRLLLKPFEPIADGEIQVAGDSGGAALERDWVVAELGTQPRDQVWTARIIEVLGEVELPGVDTLVVLRHFEIPDEFPDAVQDQAETLPEDPPEGACAGREDLRELVTVTIDGESARDFDDAISVEALPSGGYRLGVHIADVAEYVAEGDALDCEARLRGTSVYFPERAVPMLPERLSNGLCSLRPEVPRLTLTAFLDFDGQGRLRGQRLCESVIRSRARLTYDQVRDWLEPLASRERGPGPARQVAGLLERASGLLELLRARRRERGALDFDLPEGDVVLDAEGSAIGVLAYERHVAHRLIEEFMIAANEAVASFLASEQLPALYRIHDPPTPERIAELRSVLATLGRELPEKPDLGSSPGALQQLLDQLEGAPEEALVAAVVLRTMQRARYAVENRGHYALGSAAYCHFTSPIRRYPDLFVHRQLKRRLRGQPARRYAPLRLRSLAEQTSATEQRAEQAERELLQWKKTRMLAGRVGEVFSGRVTGVQPFGLFVQLDDFLVDGLVPVASLPDDYYLHVPERQSLVGERTGRSFALADAVRVRLVGISEEHRGLDLELEAGGRQPGAARRRQEQRGSPRAPARRAPRATSPGRRSRRRR